MPLATASVDLSSSFPLQRAGHVQAVRFDERRWAWFLLPQSSSCTPDFGRTADWRQTVATELLSKHFI
jgi:hypothetical protein